MKPLKTLDCIAVPILQSNLDTDQILPARYLQKPRSDDFGAYLFRDLRLHKDGSEQPGFILNQAPYRKAGIVVGRRNFGCGSSREHAVWALYDYGIRAVIAPSFGDIFFSNALKNGLLPIVLPVAIVDRLLDAVAAQPGSHVKVDLPAQTVVGPDGAPERFDIEPFAKHRLVNGIDELDYTLSQMQHIIDFEKKLEGAPVAGAARPR